MVAVQADEEPVTGRMSAAETGMEFADQASARRAVEAALAASDVPAATALARAALARGFADPLFHNLIAHELQEAGRFDEAMAELKRAYQLAPKDVVILNAIGQGLVLQGRTADALEVYDAALLVEPDYPPTHMNKGDALAALGRFDEARAALRRATEVYPDYADALAALASVEFRTGAPEEAKTLAERALALDPKQHVAAIALAELEAGEGHGSEAESLVRGALRAKLTRDVRCHATSLLGDALDAQGRYAEAFAAYGDAGAGYRELYAKTFAAPGAPTILEMVLWLLERFEKADPADWVAPPAEAHPGEAREHVFFVGFPRSGTTLLEQVLASHPDVVALDERQPLSDAMADLFTSDAKLDRLRSIGADDAAAYRERYWSRVEAFCPDVADKVFIDKHPMNSDRLALVAKLFPRAKILFAMRDPRDVVLSCFRRRFRMNPAMYQLCTLDGAATYYDAVMRLVEAYKAKLSAPFAYVRYERLVDDLRGELEPVCDFIGVEWDDAMLDFAETARRRRVRTPSAPQVVRGLYREGVGQWRNYRAQLEAVMPLLAPWVQAFGYPED